MPERRRALLLAAFALGLLALVPLLGDTFLTRLSTRIAIYGLAAVGLDLILGVTGLVSFGHAAFFGTGAYVVAIAAHHGLNEASVVWPLAVLTSGLLALVIGALSLRTRGVAFIMITLAFAQMIYFLVSALREYGADDGLRVAARNTVLGQPWLDDHTALHLLVVAVLASVTFASIRLLDTPFGLALRGTRQNERRMQALGYRTRRYQLTAFVLGGAIAGAAGMLLANHTLYVSPQTLHWTMSGQLIVMVVLGGTGSVVGPVLGAAALLFAEDALSALTQHWQVVLGPLLVGVVLFARQGIAGWIGIRSR
jgi:branched-chain amino acid transport system permease protein